MSSNVCSVFGFACVCLLVWSQSSAQETENEECLCVSFHLCENGTISTDGGGGIIPRSSFVGVCEGEGEVCCSLKKDDPAPDSATQPTKKDDTKRDSKIELPIQQDPNTTHDEPVVTSDERRPIAYPFYVPKPGCGVKRVPIKHRILYSSIDESIADFAEFPWMLAVLTEYNKTTDNFECGASLIHEQVALTAAHCVDKIPVDSLRIRAGEWNVKSEKEPLPHQERKVSRVKLHPFYNHATLAHDIALIFLDTPFTLSKNVEVICLPDPNVLFHGSRCTVTGWGKDTADANVTYHDILHKVEVPIVPCVECERQLRTTKLLGPWFKLHHSFLCAGGELRKDSCKGDGGGPLICPTDEENRWVQAGIVSWGVGCGTTSPAVYIDVSMHSNWIHRSIAQFELYPPSHYL